MTPKSTRLKNYQNYKNIEQKIKKIPFNKHAIKSGFKKRKAKKINGKVLLIAFFLMYLQGNNTFQLWAEQIGKLTNQFVSKQGIWKRVSARLTKFLKLILIDALLDQTKHIHTQAGKYKWLKKYKRVLLQDSTVIALPSWLSWCFPGNVSRGKKKSLPIAIGIKIQVVYDILSDHFIHFEITPYTSNDQSKSKDILSIVQSEDLVIRDLGYFVLDSFSEMSQQNISFISRLRYGVKLYEAETGKDINLLKELKKTGRFDKWIMLGKDQKLKARLVAEKLAVEQVNNRRRKAKNDRDKRINHCKEYYEMLEYNLFITTEDKELLSSDQVARSYEIRWRIEIIFKCWKSNFHLQDLIPKNCSLTKERVEAIIYMMLIFILLFQVTIYNMTLVRTDKIKNCFISLVKLCKYIAININLFFENDFNSLLPKILYYCRYDKRYDRQNFAQKIKLG